MVSLYFLLYKISKFMSAANSYLKKMIYIFLFKFEMYWLRYKFGIMNTVFY